MHLTTKKIRSAMTDPAKSAAVMDLVYVSDTEEGIRRHKRGKAFSYTYRNVIVKDSAILQRIKKLVIPPAWTNVWICASENGHLQVTGFDLRQRKQYRYHTLWNLVRNHTKYYRLYDFGRNIPQVRQRLAADLQLPGMPQEKVLAAVVSLMELTSIRVGNTLYEKLYGSFGLTTLKNKHVQVSGSTMAFSFKGKKGVSHCISVRSKRLAGIIKKCLELPGRELFQYVNEQGERKSIDSGMVNQYIKNISGHDFSAKDFRTWAGSVQALAAFKEMGCCADPVEVKRKVVAALDMVSKHLGNTRTVCKKYYVHPVILSLYENNRLEPYLGLAAETAENGLTAEENLLLHILEKERFALHVPAA